MEVESVNVYVCLYVFERDLFNITTPTGGEIKYSSSVSLPNFILDSPTIHKCF